MDEQVSETPVYNATRRYTDEEIKTLEDALAMEKSHAEEAAKAEEALAPLNEELKRVRAMWASLRRREMELIGMVNDIEKTIPDYSDAMTIAAVEDTIEMMKKANERLK